MVFAVSAASDEIYYQAIEMNIVLPNDSSQALGGGFSFRRNFLKGLLQHPGYFTAESWHDADVILVPSSTMVTKETWNEMRASSKKMILRVDNAPRNSRNRNTGSSFLKKFGREADAVVYQSEWSRNYLQPFIGASRHTVINNGVDTEIFNPKGERVDFHGQPTFLYSRFNRDETKRWETVWYRYQDIYRKNNKARLIIVGKFSPENEAHNFDFFMGEKYQFLGIIHDAKDMAKIYRSCDYLFAPYFMDCYSNTYLEAIACGCQLFEPDLSGGTLELIQKGPVPLAEMVGQYIRFFETL